MAILFPVIIDKYSICITQNTNDGTYNFDAIFAKHRLLVICVYIFLSATLSPNIPKSRTFYSAIFPLNFSPKRKNGACS